MNVFSDEEPDLMGLEIVREFDHLRKKFCSIFDDDLNEWEKSSDVSIRSEAVREEDVLVSGRDIKIVSQLPINNRKEDIKVVANDDYSITISHLNSKGKRFTRTSDIPYNIDFKTAKATYKMEY